VQLVHDKMWPKGGFSHHHKKKTTTIDANINFST
jgi:hypothetical protein